jgi:hypothetical protein
MRRTLRVWQEPSRFRHSAANPEPLMSSGMWEGLPSFKENASIALSTASSAICLYVVHLPPVQVRRPEEDTVTRWFRTRDSVFFASGSRTRGRIPVEC